MIKTYPNNKYRITYDEVSKRFSLFGPDSDITAIDSHINGRELGKDAWALGADEVVYDYDLGRDEHILLKSRYYAKP